MEVEREAAALSNSIWLTISSPQLLSCTRGPYVAVDDRALCFRTVLFHRLSRHLGRNPALHTPLMAVTNAISAIVVVGAMLVAGSGSAMSLHARSEVVGFLAVFLASINIFGGFVVTTRMLAMFKKKKK